MRQHRGGNAGGGNHRGSIFRLIVGTALVSKEPLLAVPTWDVGNSADRATREGEHAFESKMSEVIRASVEVVAETLARLRPGGA